MSSPWRQNWDIHFPDRILTHQSLMTLLRVNFSADDKCWRRSRAWPSRSEKTYMRRCRRGWKLATNFGYNAKVPQERGRSICSTEACKHGSSESIGPVPVAHSHSWRHKPIAACAVNTARFEKCRGIPEISEIEREEEPTPVCRSIATQNNNACDKQHCCGEITAIE